MKKLLIVVVLLIVAAVVYKEMGSSDAPIMRRLSGEIVNPYPPGSALHAQQQEFVDRFNADPALRERFAGTFTSKGLYAEMNRALKRGARSLGSAQLISVTRAMAAVIPRLPQKSCAKLIRPRDDFDRELGADFRAALERLPPVHHRNFWNFYLDALKSEIEQRPELPVNKTAQQMALNELGARYPGQFGDRLLGVINNPTGSADEDACWAINSMVHTSTQLSPDHAEVLARLIWGGVD
ncbi:hypothetical protein [Arenimonas daejeonensis]|uniref:hypothetical protein n=1 Tax=Arenimonas daejeonensis TaxID=370777 RepID=UPI0011BD8B52|nr:hypothetical protein [Arenimonas daejeonensis]